MDLIMPGAQLTVFFAALAARWYLMICCKERIDIAARRHGLNSYPEVVFSEIEQERDAPIFVR